MAPAHASAFTPFPKSQRTQQDHRRTQHHVEADRQRRRPARASAFSRITATVMTVARKASARMAAIGATRAAMISNLEPVLGVLLPSRSCVSD
jgi:hypothetical protein